MNSLSRRDFLKTASATALSALAAGYPRQLLAAADDKIKPTADTVIILWMAGGMAHTETFDPKHYTPFKAGLKPDEVLSTFPQIDTAVDNIKLTEGLEQMAKVMDRATLIRSYTAGDLGFILHSRHQYQWHTGYAPPQTVAAPHIGSVIARTLGPVNPAVPAFIDIRPAIRFGRRRGTQGFSYRRFSWQRIRPVHHFQSGTGGRKRPPPGGYEPVSI
jgi:Protein of unknown function (DUF1501)/TAT (twin-arginine translocation) pathway signal sequence